MSSVFIFLISRNESWFLDKRTFSLGQQIQSQQCQKKQVIKFWISTEPMQRYSMLWMKLFGGKLKSTGTKKWKTKSRNWIKWQMTLWSFAYQSSGFHHSYINVSPATSMLMTFFEKFEMLSTDFSINITKITLSATLLLFLNYLRLSDLLVGPNINSGNPSKVKNHIFQAGQIERLKLTFWLQKANNLIDVVTWQWAKSSLQKLFGQNKMNIFNHWLPIQNKILNFQK